MDVFQPLHLGCVDEEPAVAWQADVIVDDVGQLDYFFGCAVVLFADIYVAVHVVMHAALTVPQLQDAFVLH